MRINYFSDLHLEFGPLDLPDNDADIIVAAGDIGIYKQGMDWLKRQRKPVIYVAGNHEFYTHEYNKTLAMLKKEGDTGPIHFLENNCYVFKEVRFLGCTLWTDLFLEGESKAESLSKSLNDFRKISFKQGQFDAENFTRIHFNSLEWLKNELAQPFAGQTVVVTHHAPSYWSWSDAPSAIKKLAYCNDLKSLLHEYEVAAWFHGHVHSVTDYRVAGARILCNPRGYDGRKLVDDFDVNKIVEI